MNDSDCLDAIRGTANAACAHPLSNAELVRLVGDLLAPMATSRRLRMLQASLCKLVGTDPEEGASDAPLLAQIAARLQPAAPTPVLKTGAPIQFAPHPRLFVSPPPVTAADLMLRLYAWEEITYPLSRDVLRYADANGISVPQACVNAGVLPDTVLQAVAQLMGLPVAVGLVDAGPTVVGKLPAKMAHDYNALPLRIEGNALVVATCDPANIAALDDLKFIMAIPQLRVELCSEDAFRAAFRSIYSSTNHDLVQSLLA